MWLWEFQSKNQYTHIKHCKTHKFILKFIHFMYYFFSTGHGQDVRVCQMDDTFYIAFFHKDIASRYNMWRDNQTMTTLIIIIITHQNFNIRKIPSITYLVTSLMNEIKVSHISTHTIAFSMWWERKLISGF